MICCVCSSTAAFPQSRTTSFWAITSTEESNRWRPSACCLPTRSNTRRTFSCSEETTSAPASTEYMGKSFSSLLSIYINFIFISPEITRFGFVIPREVCFFCPLPSSLSHDSLDLQMMVEKSSVLIVLFICGAGFCTFDFLYPSLKKNQQSTVRSRCRRRSSSSSMQFVCAVHRFFDFPHALLLERVK